MCDSVLSCLLEQGFKDLRSFWWKLIRFGKNVKEFDSTICEFKLYLEGFYQVLGDTNRDISPEMHKWLEKVDDLAYDIEGILDVVNHETKQRQRDKFSCTNVLPTSIKLCYKLWNDIKTILNGIEEVKNGKELTRYKPSGNHSVRIRSQGPTPIEPEMFGRESDKEMIIDFLLRSNNHVGDQRCGIIPIVGMGGVGKTTLAQHVFKDERVVTCFDMKAWACASMDFDVCRTFKGILEQLTGSCNIQDPSSIMSMLHIKLKDKKVLIILDDLWEEKILEWRQFMAPFVDAGPGSKVIVTTRDSAIANRIRTVESVINLSLLSDDDCWSLFFRHSELETNTSSQSQFVNIGRQISDKCGGLPLAAVVIGSLLRRNDSEEEWRAVLNSRSWVSKGGQSEITLVLKMSYDNLPYCAKSCFAFCTIFPEDYEFDREGLVDIWLLAGVIKSREQGRAHFDDLVSRYLLLRREKEDTYVMHDLIRRMGQQVCGSRYKYYGLDKVRHQLIDSVANLHEEKKALRLRTLRLAPTTCDITPKGDVVTRLLKYRNLRMLWLENVKIVSMPKLLCEMRYLRYLRLDGCAELEEIASEIGRLSNLSELYIWDCPRLIQLPSEIGSLNNLSKLQITKCPRLTQLPSEIGRLSYLSHLYIWDCSGLSQLTLEIGKLSNLFKLQIKKCPKLEFPSRLLTFYRLSTFLPKLQIEECSKLTEQIMRLRRDFDRMKLLVSIWRSVKTQICLH